MERLPAIPVTASRKRTWRKQRIAWILMLFAVILLFSGLRESEYRNQAEGSMRADYVSNLQRNGLSALHVCVRPVTNEEYVYLWLDRAYLRKVRIEQIVPKPDDVSLGLKHMVYRFRIYPEQKRTYYSFYIRPVTAGDLKGSVRNHRGEVCNLKQVIQ